MSLEQCTSVSQIRRAPTTDCLLLGIKTIILTVSDANQKFPVQIKSFRCKPKVSAANQKFSVANQKFPMQIKVSDANQKFPMQTQIF